MTDLIDLTDAEITDAKRRNRTANEFASKNPEAVADAAMASEALARTLGAPEAAGLDGVTALAIRTDLSEAEDEQVALLRDVAGALWLRSRIAAHSGVVGFDARANAVAITTSLAKIPAGFDAISALTLVVEGIGEPPHRRHLIVAGSMHERTGLPHHPLVRVPALMDAALTAVEVDGEAFATPIPGGIGKSQMFRRPRSPAQGELWPAPRTLDGETADPVLRLVAGMELTGDERNTLRGDVIAISRIVYALTGPLRIPPDKGAVLMGGKDTEANRLRWFRALEVLRWATVNVNERTGEWRDLASVTMGAGGDGVIGPPQWWKDGEGKSRYRLTAGLLRPALIRDASRGTGEGYWSSLARTVDGIEALLSYGPSAGKGRGGRTPDLLRPADGRKTGPGPEAFIPWRNVLRAAGENVEPDADPKGAAGRRYRRRVEALESAGYMAADRNPARTGDSVEIVSVATGGRGRRTGLIVRASARFVEAIKRGGERTRIPASSAFAGAFTGEAGGDETDG